MKIYNTLAREKQEFIPQEDKKVKMYVCGPTVYDYIHIGNARPMVVFDTFRRYLQYLGYEVKYVVNFTDVDDKIINKAIKENVDFRQITEKYINAFMEDAKDLNLDEKDTIHPKATETMDDIIQFVKELEDMGAAYNVDGNVYFDVSKAKGYGKLSGKKIEDLIAGASNRVDENSEKKNPTDFALWKKTKLEKEPSWQSPWGKGRPGWHIECSTMSRKYLGDTLDIHAGGEDLEFPHHENEIAQSETLNKKPFANYWMHNGMIQVSGTKMSKSLGNFFTLHDIKKEFDLMVIRFWLLSSSYRLPINFTREIIEQAKNSLDRLNNARFRMDELLENTKGSLKESEKSHIEYLDKLEDRFKEVMDDDLNTADAITVLFDIVKFANTNLNNDSSNELVNYTLEMFIRLENVLGIENRKKDISDLDIEKIEEMIEQRAKAKKEKNYALADSIRDKLDSIGIAIKDTREKTTRERK
ncbi:MAG: cysteine--tRNA ligase [Tissierellia bacterium]|nr:cysteine--tRNA ligase [Tissierellia bacterium]